MKITLIALVLLLSACATGHTPENAEKGSTGPTLYGKLSVSLDWVSVNR